MTSCNITSNNSSKLFLGNYELNENFLNVEIQDFDDVSAENYHVFSPEVNYQELLISDFKNNIHLYSNSFYRTQTTYGGLANLSEYRTKFFLKTKCFEDAQKLIEEAPQIKAITYYHPILNQILKCPCFNYTFDTEHTNFIINNNSNEKIILIQSNNIEKLELGGIYSYSIKNWDHSISIETENYITIHLQTPIDCEDLFEYTNELDIYLNTYCPSKLRSYKTHILTTTNKEYEVTHHLLGKNKYQKKHIQTPVKTDFFEFLEKMYKTINFRDAENQNKFSPLDFKKSLSLENNYLFYFRCIDLYMGEYLEKQNPTKKYNTFDKLSIFIDKYLNLFNLDDNCDIQYFKNVLNSLRNQYVHNGYYLSHNEFDVKSKRKTVGRHKLDYIWLYKITCSLKLGVFKFLYTNILELDIEENIFNYCFKKL